MGAVLAFLGKTAGVEVRWSDETVSHRPIITDVEDTPVAEVFTTATTLADLEFVVLDARTILVSPRQQ